MAKPETAPIKELWLDLMTLVGLDARESANTVGMFVVAEERRLDVLYLGELLLRLLRRVEVGSSTRIVAAAANNAVRSKV